MLSIKIHEMVIQTDRRTLGEDLRKSEKRYIIEILTHLKYTILLFSGQMTSSCSAQSQKKSRQVLKINLLFPSFGFFVCSFLITKLQSLDF